MARTSATLALVLALAACTNTHVVGSRHTVHVGLTEYRLSPQSVRAPAGELRIFVRNYGRLTHDLVIFRGARVEGGTPPIMPGSQSFMRVRLSRGTYLMTSNLFSDQALGLYGTLVVH
mgnify:CR=1 FL=1